MKKTPLMPEEALLKMFQTAQALLQGHFLLSSGLHSPQYFQCAKVLCVPGYAKKIGQALAGLAPQKPGCVISPAMGGLIIGHEVAQALKVPFYFSERENGVMTLRRGFQLKPKEKALIVEDVITTGKSTKEVAVLVQGLGAQVLGALSIVCRARVQPDLGMPLKSLIHMPAEACPEQECVLCSQGIPVIKPGSRDLSKP